MMTLCASPLAWRLGTQVTGDPVSGAYVWAFMFLCTVDALRLVVAIRLPRWLDARK